MTSHLRSNMYCDRCLRIVTVSDVSLTSHCHDYGDLKTEKASFETKRLADGVDLRILAAPDREIVRRGPSRTAPSNNTKGESFLCF